MRKFDLWKKIDESSQTLFSLEIIKSVQCKTYYYDSDGFINFKLVGTAILLGGKAQLSYCVGWHSYPAASDGTTIPLRGKAQLSYCVVWHSYPAALDDTAILLRGMAQLSC